MKAHLTSTNLPRSALALGAVLVWGLGLNLSTALAGEGSWMRRANMPAAVAAAAGCEVDGILYVAGGETSFGHPVQTLYAYDPQSDRWTRKADMPS